MDRKQVRDLLLDAADSSYKEFNDRIANCDTAPSVGVRVPEIRRIGKEITRGQWRAYLKEMEALEHRLSEKISAGQTEDVCLPLLQEEHMLQGIVIGAAKMEKQERISHLDRWIPGILSWADCDSCVSGFKFMKKEQPFWFDYNCRWLAGGREFEVRFVLICLMDYFINDDYIDRVLEIFAEPCGHPAFGEMPYYIRMAQAWALSVCFVKYREKTLSLFKKQTLDPWVQNKAIQKCRESYRVTAEDKEMLKTLKL